MRPVASSSAIDPNANPTLSALIRPLRDQRRAERGDDDHAPGGADPPAPREHARGGGDQPEHADRVDLSLAEADDRDHGDAGERLLHGEQALVVHQPLHDAGQADDPQPDGGGDRVRGHAGIRCQQRGPDRGDQDSHPGRVATRLRDLERGLRARHSL